jgi:hypothetical protein
MCAPDSALTGAAVSRIQRGTIPEVRHTQHFLRATACAHHRVLKRQIAQLDTDCVEGSLGHV